MLDPLEIQAFPSCYNCLSWSEDGEIAVAAGQDVLILTPKPSSKENSNDASSSPKTDWERTRFRVNSFMVNEWPIVFPQPRDHFSVGAEQSMSHVASLAWSPPGLAKYRRSILAVLTSNMVLSLWALQSGKWTRIAIINKALEKFFREDIETNAGGPGNQRFFRKDVEDQTARIRKTNIRSFAWTPALKVPAQSQLYPGPESRWGFPLLAVSNEENVLVFLRVQHPSLDQASPDLLRIEVVVSVSLPPNSGGFDQVIQPRSLFASAVQSQVRMVSLASGPWVHQSQDDESNGQTSVSATVNVAAMQGANLRVAKLTVLFQPQASGPDEDSRHNLTFSAEENTAVSAGSPKDVQLTGPIQWTREVESGKISMTIGAVGHLATLLGISEYEYTGQGSKTDPSNTFTWSINVQSADGTSPIQQHYERISGMTISVDPESKTSILQFGTAGGYAATKLLNDAETPSPAPWSNQVEDVRDRYDIDRDLGGLAVSRVWGMASMQGLVAAAATQHPGDVVEYRIAADDRTTLVFSTANGQPLNLDHVPFLRESPTNSDDFLRGRRDIVLQYILGEASTSDTLTPRVLYAAACCAIVQSQNAGLIASARETLEGLSATTRVDMTDELAKSSEPGSTIEAKSAEVLNAPGGDIFEKCDVCEAGIGWYSAQEAQCATGHMFVRCGLTFLAIQEPGVSKFCSKCENEYLDEGLIGLDGQKDIQQACMSLSRVFDICVYCNGKFRP